MKKNIFAGIVSCIAVFTGHAAYVIWDAERIANKWLVVDDTNWLSRYLDNGDYMLSISYGVASGFTVYALLRFLQLRSGSSAGGVIGGVTLTGGLYVGACFLLGCCGSPMAAVYISLLGSTALGFAKPLVLSVTLVSVGIGVFWLEKRSKGSGACCVNEQDCGENLLHK